MCVCVWGGGGGEVNLKDEAYNYETLLVLFITLLTKCY